jgi:hypothetical protein
MVSNCFMTSDRIKYRCIQYWVYSIEAIDVFWGFCIVSNQSGLSLMEKEDRRKLRFIGGPKNLNWHCLMTSRSQDLSNGCSNPILHLLQWSYWAAVLHRGILHLQVYKYSNYKFQYQNQVHTENASALGAASVYRIYKAMLSSRITS